MLPPGRGTAPAQVGADAVALPAGCLAKVVDGCPAGQPQQGQDLLKLAAGARRLGLCLWLTRGGRPASVFPWPCP